METLASILDVVIWGLIWSAAIAVAFLLSEGIIKGLQKIKQRWIK